MIRRNRIFAKSILATLFLFTITSFAQTITRSTNPPARNGVTRANAPQFIVIGADDNTNAHAFTWMDTTIANGRNRDGSRRYMSFYVNTRSGWSGSNVTVRNAARAAYDRGHEVSNHTHDHPNIRDRNMTELQIFDNIMQAQNAMVAAGIPAAHQFGFRTPFLAHTPETFTAMRRAGILYDCSITSTALAGNHNYPYNSGQSHNVQGLWIVPATNVTVHPNDRAALGNRSTVAGLDWNLWSPTSGGGIGNGMDSAQTVRALMFSLTESLAGNRAPFTFGPHSQYYFDSTAAATGWFPNITAAQRRGAFREFVRQASLLEDVFFVSGDMVVRWMLNPVPAAQFRPDDYHRSSPTSIMPREIHSSKTPNNASVSIANGNINLHLPTAASNANIALYDVRGRLLFERNVAVNGNIANVALPQSIVRNQAVILQVKTNSDFNLTKRILVK